MVNSIEEENAKFKAIISSITECIKSVDKNYCLIDMNATGLSLIGASCLFDVQGQSLLDLIVPEHRESFKRGVDKVFKGEIIDQEFEIISLDGTRRSMHQIAVPYYNPENPHEVVEMVAVTRDVTAKKKQDATLAQLKRNELINSLSAGIAHDFNNILGVIAGNAELISMRNSNPAIIKPTQSIAKSIDRAQNLTNKLLKFSKGYQGENTLAPFSEVLADMQQLTEEIIPSNINVNWNLEDSPPINVSKHDFEDVLLNLLLNATAAIKKHGTVSLDVREVFKIDNEKHFVLQPSHSKSYLLIEVIDDGMGIAPELIEDIFLPFKSYNKKEKGSGLGLAIVYSYLESKNFGLSVNSIVGEGSTFSIWIPYNDENTQKQPLRQEKAVGDITQSLNIILVDDEKELQDTTAALLELKKHHVTKFSVASEAVDFIEMNRDMIDLIITDEIMPGEIQGHNILESYKDKIPTILITGYADNEKMEGYQNYIVKKPFSIEELLQKASLIIQEVRLIQKVRSP
ncbi:ATP-binding protein [Thalassotalea sp. G2M2-11]|uniref:ATP-binding protein n=1 Tax=Thalassotalea sp. G2M2-11 TaxID=2787627 RepID=UPI0019D2AE2C|nr:ATP-binding protein [Thalassotalea sp. G2M2-11]